MNQKILLSLALLFSGPAYAQLDIAFNGHFTSFFPYMNGDTNAFQKHDNSLRSDGPPVSGTVLKLNFDFDQTDSFELYADLELDFATSANNRMEIGFFESRGNELSPSFMIEIGGKEDRFALWDSSGELLGAGLDKRIHSSRNRMEIRLIKKDEAWILTSRLEGETTWRTECHFEDSMLRTIERVQMRMIYTSSNAENFHLYRVRLGSDNKAPLLTDFKILNDSTAVLSWSESIAIPGSVSSGTATAILEAKNASRTEWVGRWPMKLKPHPFDSLKFAIKGFGDEAENIQEPTSRSVLFLKALPPEYGQLRFTELMFKPGAGKSAFIELLNTSEQLIDLGSLSFLHDHRDYELPDTFLFPGSLIVLAEACFPGTPCLEMNLPSFDQAGQLILMGEETIDLLAYTENMIAGASNYSIELQDTSIACSRKGNWKQGAWGGSPGIYAASKATSLKSNFIYDAYPLNNELLRIRFSEPILPVHAVELETDWINTGATVKEISPDLRQIEIACPWVMEAEKQYTFRIRIPENCFGSNEVFSSRVGLPVAGKPIIFNEVMPDPQEGSAEYIELYNASTSVLDVKGMMLQRISSSGFVEQEIVLCPEGQLFFPGQYMVLSKSEPYPDASPTSWIQTDIPDLLNDGCRLVLLDSSGQVLDRLSYASEWHDPELISTKGVSLERIHPELNEWYSAGANVGFCTPTLQNSQYSGIQEADNWKINSQTFSPDGDGFEDLLTLSYSGTSLGDRVRVEVYDARGAIRYVWVENDLLSAAGTYTWNGHSDLGEIPPGRYAVVIQVFNQNRSKVKRFPLRVIGP